MECKLRRGVGGRPLFMRHEKPRFPSSKMTTAVKSLPYKREEWFRVANARNRIVSCGRAAREQRSFASHVACVFRRRMLSFYVRP